MFIKKIIVCFGIAACSIAYANELSNISNIVSESSAVLEVKQRWLEIAKTNTTWKCWRMVLAYNWNENFIKIGRTDKYSKEQLREIDMAFGNAGVRCSMINMPCCFTNEVNALWVNSRRREICYKYRGLRLQNFAIRPNLDDLLFLFETDILNEPPYGFNAWKNAMVKSYLVELKAYLRMSGKSLVTKNGVNPMQPYMERFATALNAPKMNGLTECFMEINRQDLSFDFAKYMTDNEIEALKEKFLNFDIIPAYMDRTKTKLLVALGVDGYNQLVRQYNGE